ncbi:MAG: hypothetical protein ACRBF0_08100 [Calditrichia bacterium]
MKNSLQEYLTDWLNNTLDSETRKWVEEQLKQDPKMEAYFNSMAELLNEPGKKPLPELEVDPFLATRIKASRVNEASRIARGWKQLSLSGAMLALAITMGVFLGKGLAEQGSTESYSNDLDIYSSVLTQDVFGDSWSEDLSTEGEE